MSDPITLVLLPVIDSALRFATSGMDAYQARITAQTRDRDRQAEASERETDRQEARQLYVQARRDKLDEEIRALKAARELDLFRLQLEYYPVASGPGTLRESIRLIYHDPWTMPPLVLVMPSHRDSDATWGALSSRLNAALMPLQDKSLIVARRIDRWLSWPDASLVENDLYDLPTVIVTTEVVGGRLSVSLGGCNLGGDHTVRPLTQVAWLELPDAAYWTESRLSALEATSKNGFHRPSPLDSPSAEHLLQLEWATRISLVAVVAAVDAYHLMRSCGYSEQLDDAVALLGSDLDLPLRLSLPEGALADPAYHLLHQARRQLDRGSAQLAAASVTAAIDVLGGYQQQTPDQAIVSARSAGRLEVWHQTLLEELGAHGGQTVVPAAVVRALHEPVPEVATAGATAALEGPPESRIRNDDPDAPLGTW